MLYEIIFGRKIQTICVFVIITTCYNTINAQIIKNTYVPKYTIQQLQTKLETIFNQKSSDSALAFFTEWNNLIPPHNNNSKQNNVANNIHQIISDLFQSGQFGKTKLQIYNCSDFFVFRCNIRYDVIPSLKFQKLYNDKTHYEKNVNYKSICVRPIIANVDPQKLLFLTNEYEAALDSFTEAKWINYRNFLDKLPPINDDILFKYNQLKIETQKRMEFLQTYISIKERVWGGLIIGSYPMIYNIIFDDKFRNAYVDYRDSFNTIIYHVKLTKHYGIWIAKKSTAIVEIE